MKVILVRNNVVDDQYYKDKCVLLLFQTFGLLHLPRPPLPLELVSSYAEVKVWEGDPASVLQAAHFPARCA